MTGRPLVHVSISAQRRSSGPAGTVPPPTSRPREKICHSQQKCLFFDLCIHFRPCVPPLAPRPRRGGRDERFIRGTWCEEVERELIRISLSRAITLLLTFHPTIFPPPPNKSLSLSPSLALSDWCGRQADAEGRKCLTLVGWLVMHYCVLSCQPTITFNMKQLNKSPPPPPPLLLYRANT